MTHSGWLRSQGAVLALVAIGYVATGKLGLHFASVHPSATPIWPPTGIALAASILAGYRVWPAVFVGAFAVNATTAGSIPTSLGIALGNTLEALTGAYLVHRWANGIRAFQKPRSIFAFCLVAGLAATAVSATIGVTTLALGGEAPWSRCGTIWLTWWLGDAAGALVVAPFLIVWLAGIDRPPLRGRREAIGVALVIIAVAALVFGGAVRTGARDAPLAFFSLPPLVWAAYRFGPHGAATGLLLLGAIATAGTVRDSGPFAVDAPNASLLLLQLFLVTISGTVLPLAALADELSRRARTSAENARLYLESEGRRRTAEAFLETSRALTSSLDIWHVADRIVASVRALLGGTVAIVYQVDPDSGSYEALAVGGNPGPGFTGAFAIPGGVGTIGLAVREQRAVVTADVTSDPRIVLTAEVRARLEQSPHRAVLAVPLVSDRATIGAFLVGDGAGRVFSDEERVVAEAFAHHAAIAITNAHRFVAERREREDAERARERAEAAERQMATLTEITRSITSSLDFDTVLQRIAQGAQELCGSDTAAIFLRDGESEAMVPRYRVGPPIAAYRTLRILPGHGIGGQVLLTGRPLRTSNYTADPRVPTAFHAIARETGTVALMVVPITIRDRIEGLLYISNVASRDFSEHDERVCVRLAGQAAAAIRNAQLFSANQAARAEAEAASRAKDEFLAVLSHELRTPLNAIVGWTRMLRSGGVAPGAVAHAIEVIDRNAAAQVQLVEDLLDVSRIVSGTLELDLQPVELGPVLAAALDAVAPSAERKGIALGSHIADGVDCVRADAVRLQQVISNLLVNAVKFTGAGGTVQLTAAADADTVRISVADTGCGIDPPMLPHVFERFRQADSSTTRQHGGLGLGLALVKHIAELHGGTVQAHSDGRGKGATFTLTLTHVPQPAAVDRKPPDARGTPAAADLSGVTVLVVDDDPDARELCIEALHLHGAAVTASDSVGDALDRMAAAKPDIVIADIAMPGEDGFELIRRVRAGDGDRGRRTGAIALTAYASVEDRIRIMRAGFDAYVAKPFERGELAAMVRDLARMR